MKKYVFLLFFLWSIKPLADVSACSFIFYNASDVHRLNEFEKLLSDEMPNLPFAEEFAVVRSNSTVSQAQVILIAENHADLASIYKSHKIISAFGESNYVLSESIRQTEDSVHLSFYDSLNKSHVRHLKSRVGVSYNFSSELLLKLYGKGFFLGSWDFDLAKWLLGELHFGENNEENSIVNFVQLLRQSMGTDLVVENIKIIETQIRISKGFQVEDVENLYLSAKLGFPEIDLKSKILDDQLKLDISHYIELFVDALTLQRELMMVRKVDQYIPRLGKNKKIFIIAGSDHTDASRMSVQELFSKYKTVIIEPVERRMTHMQEYLQYMENTLKENKYDGE